MYSQIALKIYAAKKENIIKTNAQFWRQYGDIKSIETLDVDTAKYEQELDDCGVSLVCAFDDDFPTLPRDVKPSEKPFLFAYKGDINLLKNTSRNIAVIGVLTPTQEIVKRENIIVKELVDRNFNIVSGLAKGCDTVAHSQCLAHSGRTIAFLPTTLNNIYPKNNKKLAEEIEQNGGLLITEYVTEPTNRYGNIKRFIERDRLQAMFASKIILIASYAQGKGDSGSRHAMQKAKEYGVERFVMYNEQTDKDKPIFGLNERLIVEGATILTSKILGGF